MVRLPGSHLDTLAQWIRKPKIFAYNLEDFIEDWEESFIDNAFSTESFKTIPWGEDVHFSDFDTPFFTSNETVPISASNNNDLMVGELDTSIKEKIKNRLKVKSRALFSILNMIFSYS